MSDNAQSVQDQELSLYLDYLPAIFQDGEDGGAFLGRFLLAFQKMLHGTQADELLEDSQAFERVLDRIHTYFDPQQTPDTFLPWLGQWVALSLRDDWSEAEKRRFIQRVVPLYRQRGTLKGLQQMLGIYLQAEGYVHDGTIDEMVQIRVWDSGMQLGKVATLGEDTIVGEPRPHHFEVRLVITNPAFVDLERRRAIAKAIIEQEKPAHTTFDLVVMIPPMQVGRFSTIGYDTLLTDDE